MKLSDLPQFKRFCGRKDVKVVRHRDTTYNLPKLLADEAGFEDYQNGQSRDVFAKAKYLLSFIAERDQYAVFAGVWEVLDQEPRGTGIRYRMEKLTGFDDLEKRLVVDWGTGTRSWVQWFHRVGNKDVRELLPPDRIGDFPGFYDFLLPYWQLRQVALHPDAHRDWVRMLSAVAGVYAILDQSTGSFYLGSAYGANGIWQRWKSYAKSAHGGNVELRELLERRPDAHDHFQFSILRVMEPSARKKDVIAHEALLKKKLGSRAHGLNRN